MAPANLPGNNPVEDGTSPALPTKITVYVAGPLNADNAVDYLRNVHYMLVIANTLRKLGFAPLIPCFDMLLGIYAGDMEYEDYFDLNIVWLPYCKAVYVIAESPGVNKEIELAKQLGIPVFHALYELMDYRLTLEGKPVA